MSGRLARLEALTVSLGTLALLGLLAPGLLRTAEGQDAPIAGNEASAIGSLRVLSSAQAIFIERSEDFEYGTLQDIGKAGFIDEVLASGVKQGYRFKVVVGDAEGEAKSFVWYATAEPLEPGKTGVRCFYVDQSGIIRVSLKGPATEASPRLGAAGSEGPLLTPEESFENNLHNMKVIAKYLVQYAKAKGAFPYVEGDPSGRQAIKLLDLYLQDQRINIDAEFKTAAERMDFVGLVEPLKLDMDPPRFLFGHLNGHKHNGKCLLILTNGQVVAVDAKDEAALGKYISKETRARLEAKESAPKESAPKGRAALQRCANNLKGLAIGMILYANDYRFFPHMKPLDQAHDARDVSKVFRTLVYFKYIDNPEIFCSPGSEDSPRDVEDAVIDDPKGFQWQSSKPRDGRGKPILEGEDPDAFACKHISYTYLRRKVNAASARTSTMIAATQKPYHEVDGVKGYNVAYADGHVSFVPVTDTETIAKMKEALVFPDDEGAKGEE